MFAAYCARVFRKALGAPVVPEEVSRRNGASSAIGVGSTGSRSAGTGSACISSGRPRISPGQSSARSASRREGASVTMTVAPVVASCCLCSGAGPCASITVTMRSCGLERHDEAGGVERGGQADGDDRRHGGAVRGAREQAVEGRRDLPRLRVELAVRQAGVLRDDRGSGGIFDGETTQRRGDGRDRSSGGFAGLR